MLRHCGWPLGPQGWGWPWVISRKEMRWILPTTWGNVEVGRSLVTSLKRLQPWLTPALHLGQVLEWRPSWALPELPRPQNCEMIEDRYVNSLVLRQFAQHRKRAQLQSPPFSHDTTADSSGSTEDSSLHRKQGGGGGAAPSCSIGKNFRWSWMFSKNRDTHRLEPHNETWERAILSSTTS